MTLGLSPTRDIALQGRTLRQLAARGSIVNAVFMVALTLLGLLKGFVLAGFMTPSEFGLWGIIAATLGTLVALKQTAVGDKFVQQDAPDQEREFQKAFTCEVIITGATLVMLAAVVPVMAAVYGEPRLLAPGFVALTALPAVALQAPLWVHYRNMRFGLQRVLQSIDPVVGFAVAVVIAAAGGSYWSLIVGTVVGAWAAAAAAAASSPYALRLRYDAGTLRTYLRFSWPLMVAGLAAAVAAQVAVLGTDLAVGVAGVGAVALAINVAAITDRVDAIVTGALYPAICAVAGQLDLLRESFVKSNRLALMCAMPFGLGLSLFAADLVGFALGDAWQPAVTLLWVTGIAAAVGHVAFNWHAYMRALDRTRPLAVTAVVTVGAFVATAVPGLVLDGLEGIAWGVAAQTVAALGCRIYYVHDLFGGFAVLSHALRAAVPAITAAVVVLAVRALSDGDRGVEIAVAELVGFAAVVAAGTYLLERPLLAETLSYVSRRAPAGR